MALDDVPPHDMFLFGSSPDALDAALRGESDDPAVTALVHDLRDAYLPEGTRPRSAALVAFAGTGDGVPVGAVRPRTAVVEKVAERPVPFGRRVAVGAAAFAATITGKVVLGGAVAAAALGGLHAAEAVDVPLLPRSPQAQTVPSTVPDLPEAADPLEVLVGPPGDARSDGPDRAPVPVTPPQGPVENAPVPQPSGSDRPPASTVDRSGGTDEAPGGGPAPTTTPAEPPTTAAPVPTTGQPDERTPAGDAGEPSAQPAPEDDPAPERPARADEEPPVPEPDQARTSARP